jgi:hypothetical protein
MNKLQKKVGISLSSLLIIGLLLVSASSALAVDDGPFTLSGDLVTTLTPWTVDGTPIDHSLATCVPLVEPSALCTTTPLPNGTKVYVEGDVLSSVYKAKTISEIGTFEGILTAKTSTDPSVWTVGGKSFTVSAAVGGSFAVKDVVFITYYKNVSGTFVALKVEKGETEEYVGKVISMSPWQVNGETFTTDDAFIDPNVGERDIVKVTFFGENIAVRIEPFDTSDTIAKALTVDPWSFENPAVDLTIDDYFDKTLDAYAGAVPGDIVKVVYYTWEGKNIVAEILLYAPMKNDNNRCEDWQTADFKIPPGIEKKLLSGLGKDDDPEPVLTQAYAMFCQGFGWGEIMQAFKLSSVNPEDLLARKAKGEGWGQIKKDFDLTPTHENNGKGHSNDETSPTGKPETTGKPDKQDNSNKLDNPGNSDHSNNNNNGKPNGKNK